MITQRILNWFTDRFADLLGLLPDLPAGLVTALANLPGLVESVMIHGSKVGFIIPWSQLVIAAGIYVAAFVTAVTIRVVRMVISHVTGGGGSL